jgi:hypothetical protein
MRRPVRALAVAGALAGTALLAGCDKPVPKITVQSGSFSTTITASSYCFDPKHCRAQRLELPAVSARPDDTVLIDVPRALAGRGWSATAISLNTLKAIGGATVVEDRHSTRVAASINQGAPFIVQVQQLRHGKPDGSKWSFLVKISDSA